MRDAALAYAAAHREAALAALVDLLRIPSVSTLPEHAADMEAAADWVAAYLRDIGLSGVELLATPGYPVVYGEWLGAGDAAPTLLVYGHYDVQPVDPLDEWRSPPFSPTVAGDNLVARGVSDDKGQFLAILAALEAYLGTAGRLPVNVKVMIEGEEEISSPNLAEVMARERGRLRADALLIADQPLATPDLPLIMYGTRGNCTLDVTVQGPATDLHSGTWGGAVENPLNVLTRLLASLQDPHTRRILVEGFYDQVRPVDDAERALLNAGPASDAAVQYLTGAPGLAGEAGYTTAERMSIRPTLEVHGLSGGFSGEGRKTVLPARGAAKLGLRLVPDQDPEDIARRVEAHLRALAPPTVRLDVRTTGGSYPTRFDYRAPAIQAAAAAYRLSFGAAPAYIRGGGSLPLLHDVQRIFGADLPIVLVGFGLPDDNIHAPNEKFYLPNFYRGIEMVIHYLDRLAHPMPNVSR